MSQEEITTSVHLKVFKEGQEPQSYTFSQSVIKIGQLSSCHLKLDDPSVSRMHSVLEVSDKGEVVAVDLGSKTGTIVNGKKSNRAPLQQGDELKLGDVRIQVESIGERESWADERISFGSIEGLRISDIALGNINTGSAGESEGFDPSAYNFEFAVTPEEPVSPDEVENAGEEAIEVSILWGEDSVLHVSHLNPPRNFYVGEDGNKDSPVDFLIGKEALGVERLPVVIAAGDGSISAVIPKGATGEIEFAGEDPKSIEELQNSGELANCMELQGSKQYALTSGSTVKVEYNGFTFITKSVAAGKPLGKGIENLVTSDVRKPLSYILAVFALFMLLFMMMYMAPPEDSPIAVELEEDQIVELVEEMEELEELKKQASSAAGKRHQGDEGQMGKKEAKKTNKRSGSTSKGSISSLSTAEARDVASSSGILGTLQSMSDMLTGPTSPFGASSALGGDSMNALGALMGSSVGENFGLGGLGLSGSGRGGGGTGLGTIGVGNLGTVGRGGKGSGNYGRGAGKLGGRKSRMPKVRSGSATVKGTLSKEIIRRVIQRHISEVRFCYERELNQRPDLKGRITVNFIIKPTGGVQSATVRESTMRNSNVESCITKAVRRWTFPTPQGGGIVIVNYPFVLSSSG